MLYIFNDIEFKTRKNKKREKSPIRIKKINPGKKKKLKYAKLQQLIPVNLIQEKERFFKNNFQYNPQFIYSFERLKFPVRIISTKSHILLYYNWH